MIQDPFTSAGIGTEVMPPVLVIDTNDQVYNLFPSINARVNDPSCKASAPWFAGTSTDHSRKSIVTVRAATPQDLVDRGMAPDLVSSYVKNYPTLFLQGFIDTVQKMGATPQSVRTDIEKNITCS